MLFKKQHLVSKYARLYIMGGGRAGEKRFESGAKEERWSERPVLLIFIIFTPFRPFYSSDMRIGRPVGIPS